MSIQAANLWKYFHDDEIERFRKLLANAVHNPQYSAKGHGGGINHGLGIVAGSPGTYSTSPRVAKGRKVSGQAGAIGGRGASHAVSRLDVNSRDHAGVPLLGRIASSDAESAIEFGLALIEHPGIDLYAQDAENGWTALHRALYFGNVTLARAMIEKDTRSPSGLEGSAQKVASSIIKVKDLEGNSPFDVYNATIARQRPSYGTTTYNSDDESEDEDESALGSNDQERQINGPLNGDEVFAWGSSKNYNLGFGDEDNRQYPEKVTLKRPDHLLFRFYREYLESIKDTDEALYSLSSRSNPKLVSDLPTLVANRPIVIHDVTLSKLHSAILTTDPESNLFMCGFGPGGRLGTGDEITRFSYVCIENGLAGRKIVQVALGTNHTLAIDSQGEIFSWGQSGQGVLGYSLPRTGLKDDDPISSTPRQIFGPLKREMIIGVAASAIHSVACTSTSLFTWGRNEGQLGLTDSDSRSLEIQIVPRRVAASLFKSPIVMVAAINRATIVLLENHAVCVFTNYGYKFLKFPPSDVFRNYHLQTNSLMTRYDSSADNIKSITAAGDTIAAFSTQSLFTVNVGTVDASSAASTTNPSKIRDSLTAPQRVWSLRKGHWDGIKSASVTENGSVIVCTQAGAVWRRVTRSSAKDAFANAGTFHQKDFKFQRVPGLTNVAAVRSTAFGVYAAIRKDCDITRTQMTIEEPKLWDDLNPILALHDLEASEIFEKEDTTSPRFWTPVLPKSLLELLKRAVLTSPDLEADVNQHLLGVTGNHDVEIGTTTSDVRIPVHGFMLGRSSVLRKALSIYRQQGQATIPDVLTISNGSPGVGGKERINMIFHGLDFITILNLAIYLYTDQVVDVWQYTRHYPDMAFRFRQVRVELMKTAAHLKLTQLEASVRLQTFPRPLLNKDLGLAIQDPTFFEDGDLIIELDGSEVLVHSALLCQRCPFFDGLFNGRAGGQWLDGRREVSSSAIRVDLKHVEPPVFELVLRYLYADVGSELFDDVNVDDLDEFSDLVMAVMAVADELMIDRLSQVCQEVIGRFVNSRNVCHLLNAVAPCSVTEFKDKALEYVCLQLESMLENHFLNDLDEELFVDLDNVVRENQSACLPYAKSGHADRVLFDMYPSLVEDITEERQRRLRDMAFRANLRADDSKTISSARSARFGSVDDALAGSPSQERAQRKLKSPRNEPFSPSIKAKELTSDLMFDMEDDELLAPGSYKQPVFTREAAIDSPRTNPDKPETKSPVLGSPSSFNPENSPNFDSLRNTKARNLPTKTWSSPILPSAKLGLSEIMAQASSSRTSNLSMSLSVQKTREENTKKENLSKVSQKERKRQQQKAQQEALTQPEIRVDMADNKSSSPWQVAARGPKTPSDNGFYIKLKIPSVTGALQASQQRSNSSGNSIKNSPVAGSSRAPPITKVNSTPIIPHSKSYQSPTAKAEPTLQLSMSDIIGMQRREQEVIKEAVAKRSLQEIQEEQAFQEWWDLESKRAQELEESRSRPAASGSARGKGGGRGKSGGRGRGGRGGKARGGAAA
ncbi:putative BTB/POZ domain-containing protein 1 [Glarea lozoyensis 74030]|uniref:Putative BTB/POZ domain-containing protein 1 n=1 Tax=Glarea lozoyensis (strain ATCC 74030 / MF5533) TaxID=1104152 RepID=H0EZL0_GLAL7|nr:putative BTB/POZ domain-containing protein 1 [Glarea lozoyensis 74030]